MGSSSSSSCRRCVGFVADLVVALSSTEKESTASSSACPVEMPWWRDCIDRFAASRRGGEGLVSSREKQVHREQESKDDRELCGKPRPRPPPEKVTGGSEAGTSAATVGATARPGQRRGGGVSRPSSPKHRLASRPHSKEMNDWPGRKDVRHKMRPGASSASSLNYRSLGENDSFAARSFDESLSFPPCASGLSERLLGARTLLRCRGAVRGEKDRESRKKYHLSSHALILPFFVFLLPLTWQKKTFLLQSLLLNLYGLQPRAIALINQNQDTTKCSKVDRQARIPETSVHPVSLLGIFFVTLVHFRGEKGLDLLFSCISN